MPKPIAICVEDLEPPPGGTRYVRCVALPGRQPGLRLDAAGQVIWKSDDRVACELWVSADDRLILFRPQGAAGVTLHRAGRSLEVPFGKPVVMVDQDEINVGAQRLRVHVHGEAPAVAAPSVLGRLARAAAAAVIIGSGVAAGGCKVKDIIVRDHPPEPGPPPPIDVRERPPEILAPEKPQQDQKADVPGQPEVAVPEKPQHEEPDAPEQPPRTEVN